jgi:hypothetical protein
MITFFKENNIYYAIAKSNYLINDGPKLRKVIFDQNNKCKIKNYWESEVEYSKEEIDKSIMMNF